MLLAAMAATPAMAQVGLPPSYDAQAIDGPLPVLLAGFGDSGTNAGDLNGDGEEDILTYQLAGSPSADGQVYVVSGETGNLIDTIVAPDQDIDPIGVGSAAPSPGDNESNFAFPWISKLGNNRGSSPGTFTDLASCPGAVATPATNPTVANPAPAKPLCPVTIGGPDGVPEILVGARGVDANGVVDAGRAYVFDGRTRVLLKRIDMPLAEAAAAVARGTTANRKGGPWFGRSVLNPAGLPGCAGNSSVGPCQTVPRAVEIGDMDAQGRPDIVVGASALTESTGAGPAGGTADPTSQCATAAPGAFCGAAGRAYIYRGEDIVGSSAAQVLDGTGSGETVKQLKNPDAQSTGGSQLFANSVTAIGDVGRCTNAALATGERCPAAAATNGPDGRPDVIIGALRVDLPVNSPNGSFIDAGVSYLMDGATGTILRTYEHPEPQPRPTGTSGTVFGSQFQTPASGDLGGSALPDAYIPAAAQDTGAGPEGMRQFRTGGKGYVMNGDFKVANLLIQTIDDPTPNENENFGYASVGVGNLVGGAANPKNELLVGSEGTFFTDRFAPELPAPPPPNDLHFYNGATGKVLQTIKDPGEQPGSGFGQSVMGLGDINEDGHLDFAAGAPYFDNTDGTDQGKLYIFRSKRAPAPPARPAPPRLSPPPASGCAAGTGAGVTCQRNAAGGLTITGTAGANRIVGSSGRDVIRCGAGNDTVVAGAGDDDIRCGAGNDTIDAGAGNDAADGESGNDKVSGGLGTDRLKGGSGTDRLNGSGGNDRLTGSAGNDKLSGGSGKDRLSGGSGRDGLVGGSGRDSLSGGSGNDRLNTRDRKRGDSANCGESRRDRDRAAVDRGDRVRGCERVSRR